MSAAAAGPELGVGDKAPVFADVPTSGAGKTSSTDLGSLYIIYFYPRDATPGCTCEAQDFTSMLGDIEASGAKVIGVSRDSVESHDSFVKDIGIGYPLIADVDGVVTEAYGVYKQREWNGKQIMAVERSTFIVQNGEIVKSWRGIKATGHAAEVVAALKAL